MASVLRAATAEEWWDNLNTVRTKLGLSTVSNNIEKDTILKATDINTYITNMNGLESNTYAQHADWISIDSVNAETRVKELLSTNIDTMLVNLSKICPNDITESGGLSSTTFSVISTGRVDTSYSVTSFSKTLNCSVDGFTVSNSNTSDCSRCTARSGTTFDNSGCSFSTSNSRTAFGTESGFNGLSNTSNTNRTNNADNSQRGFSNFSDFSTNGTSNFNFGVARNTNFTRFSESEATPCNNTATANSVTSQSNIFTGFGVKQ